MPLLRSISASVRFRLLVIALLPMLVLLPLLLGITTLRWSDKVDQLLTVKVNGDLTIADQYMARLLESSGDRISALGNSVAFAGAMASPDRGAFLEARRKDLGLDFLYIVQPGGSVIASSTPADPGFLPGDWPVIRAALDGAQESAVDIFDRPTLLALSPGLADQARVPLISTRAAIPTDRTVEDRGMVIHSAAPVLLPGGAPAALVGGLLLNRNLDFIDTMNALVYRARSLPTGSQGTATLFLEDVRISTNVRLFENVRALGTRVSAAVRTRVLEHGKAWLARAFVVNDWYISAYEPIVDSFGNRVGMLYVGFLETPFRAAKWVSIILISITFLLITAISVPIFLRWAGHIFRPLERMNDTIARVEAGDLGARIGPGISGDEIGRLAHHLDDLLDQVQDRDLRLRNWAAELNDKVEERTRDLQHANRQLQQATEQLILSEKLAAVGEITASVAHEINNPVAVIQGNLDVARQILGAGAVPVATEFNLIDDQVHRITTIVTRLLQFTRPGEFSGAADAVRPAEVISDCLVLTRHLLDQTDIALLRADTATATVRIDRTELQQVMINLMVNAIHAMPDGGKLTLTTRDALREAEPGVEIEISDSGNGIPPELCKRIFDPFFTTKGAGGSGLGLSISRMLVTRAGGRIDLSTAPGTGSRFKIWLPAGV